MTEPFDFLNGVNPEPIDEPVTVPDWKAADDEKPSASKLFSRKPGVNGRTRTRAPKTEKPAPPYQPGRVYDAVLETYGAVAFGLMPFKPNVALTIMSPAKEPTEDEPNPKTVAENCAEAWEQAAKHYPWVRRMVEGGVGFAVIMALITAHAPIFAAAVQGTPLAEKLSPAAATEAMLRRQAEKEET